MEKGSSLRIPFSFPRLNYTAFRWLCVQFFLKIDAERTIREYLQKPNNRRIIPALSNRCLSKKSK